MASDSISPIRVAQVQPHQPPVVLDAVPAAAMDRELPTTTEPTAVRPFAFPARETPSAAAFGPQFRFSKLSEPEAVDATNVALAAARDNVASTGFVMSPHDFVPQLTFRDELGRTNVRMDRLYAGVPIFGAQAIAHLDANGRVASITGEPIPSILPIDVKPTVAAAAARATAVTSMGGTPKEISAPELVIVKLDDGNYRLAYHVTGTVDADQAHPPRRTHVFVDAMNGEVLPIGYDESHGFLDESQVEDTRTHLGSRQTTGFSLRPQSQTAAPTIPPGHGNSIYSGIVPLATSRGPMSGYVLRDPATGAETRDANNSQGVRGAGGLGGIFGRPTPAQPIGDANNVWGEPTDPQRARAGIDAHYAAVQYMGYLRDMFGRNSIDDRGYRLTSNVHVRQNLVNAYWDGTSVNYGDGDGRVAGPMVDPDIAGHEITHGLTSNTSRLIYRGESGALNEAGSDILGSAGLSWYLRGRGDQGIATDYMIGENAFTPSIQGDALRYMDSPTRDRRNPQSEMYSRDNVSTMYRGEQDKGGVHLNSGIANNFFYLLANGGTNPTSRQSTTGIGMEKALRIYYRAHTVYFTPSTNFVQARAAWERAATDLYGANSTELATVRRAASAVGIEPQNSTTVARLVS